MGIKLIDPARRKYRIMFWHRYRCHRKIVYGSHRLAQEIEAQMKGKLIEGTYFPERQRRSFSMSEAVDAHSVQEKPKRAPSAYRDLVTRCGYIREFFGSKRLEEIRPSDIQDYRNHLSKRMGLMALNRHHGQLRRIFNWAKDAGMFHGENPASSRKVKMPSDRKHWRRDFLSEEQARRLLEVAHPRLRPIILAAVLTGMRKGELLAMKKRDVNLDNCVISIPDSKTGEPGWVPINETLFRVLEPIVKSLPSPDSPVFDFGNFQDLWEKARKTASLDTFVFHCLRHTMASWIVIKTGNLAIAQHLLRHRTPTMTARYAHLAPGHLRQAVLGLDSAGLLPAPGRPSGPEIQGQPITQVITLSGALAFSEGK